MITLEDAKAMYKKWESAELSEMRAAMLPKVKKEYIYAIIRGIPLDRLETVCDAERDGRCVVLPCKVGDTVYKLWYKPCHHGNTYPDGMDCCGCEDECDIERAVIPFTANSFEHIVGMMGSFNRLWFLTPESAEEALRKERI